MAGCPRFGRDIFADSEYRRLVETEDDGGNGTDDTDGADRGTEEVEQSV